MKMSKILYPLKGLSFALLVLYGCAHVPSTPIKFINKADDKLLVTLYESYKHERTHIKVLGDKKLNLIAKIEIEDSRTPTIISKTFEGNDSLVIWLIGRNGAWAAPSAVYEVGEGDKLKRVGEIPKSRILIDYDWDFFYFYEFGYVAKGVREVLLRRCDQSLSVEVPFHFDEDHSIAVVGVWYDRDAVWYNCVKDPIPDGDRYTGRFVLGRRMKGESRVQFFDFADELLRAWSITGDKESLWIFGFTKKPYGDAIIRFFKLDNTYQIARPPAHFLPIDRSRNSALFEDAHFLWLYDKEKAVVCRLDTETLSFQPIRLPEEIQYSVFYSDEEYLWIGGDVQRKHFAYSGSDMPCLVRLSKGDFSCSVFMIETTISESLKTVSYNFTADLLTPVTMVLGPILMRP
jgi:hypothetical protein